eukprot:CAMPEP_0117654740 /NCGR_PEP_ID=MMETSP0804-20121206/3908_1 /TAXON_ID=1074897 /ORGANISM="Tetraselmis astigmatica, Strain CCMP880" /LENGTH=926 /DNA_ID=CAMNT_0005461047 /DNA_START=141 /DNA_END=2921 /DNA_ORIENTATION=+
MAKAPEGHGQERQKHQLTSAELKLWLSSVAAMPSSAIGTLSAAPSEGPLEGLVEAVVAGRWEDALRQPIVVEALKPWATEAGSSPDEALLSAARAAGRAAIQEGGADPQQQQQQQGVVLLAAGVAALNVFTQANFAGPLPGAAQQLPAGLISLPSVGSPSEPLDTDTRDRWAAKRLQVDGEELVGRMAAPHFLLLARALLVEPLELTCSNGSGMPAHLPAASWAVWALRTVSIHQRVVSNRSATLRGEQTALDSVLKGSWADPFVAQLQVQQVLLSAGSGMDWVSALLAGCCCMELAAVADLYGDAQQAAAHLEAGAASLGMDLELAGVLGIRTVHQKEKKAQMVTKIHRTGVLAEAARLERQWHEEQPAAGASGCIAASEPGHVAHGLHDSDDLQDIMDMPKLEVDNSLLGMQPLASVEQVLLLRAAIHEKKKEAGHGELKLWRMAPFVEAVLQQEHSDPVVAAAAHLQRARHEATRTRTKQRAFLRFTQVVEGALKATGSPGRVRLVHSTPLPSLPAVRKEYGELMVSIGLLGEAMRVFEELELWDSLITCYTLMDKKLQATELVRKRLEVHPDDPKLLCALGDCTGDEQAYHDAWEKSGKRSARAMRSLADTAHRRRCYMEAAGYWEAALALNPLHSSGWFSLGHCYVQEKEYEKAVQALTRCCQLQPENGASWNNIAAVCLTQKKYKEAFSALSESAKYMRENWHTWDNYVQVAVLVENWPAVVSGMHHMLRLRNGKNLPMEALSSVLDHLESLSEAQLKEAYILVGRLRDFLRAASAGVGTSSAFWRDYARYHALVKEHTAQRECLIKSSRAVSGTSWTKDEGAFREVAGTLCDLAEVTLTILRDGDAGARELSQVRMQIRGVLKQGEQHFEEHEAYLKLSGLLLRVVEEEGRLKQEAGVSDGAAAEEGGSHTAGAGMRSC